MDFNLTEFIKVQLAHELKYLLVGATTWSAYSREDVGPDGRPDLATLAMEAAYVHVRNLNEFLRREDRWQPRFERSPHGGVTPYLWTAHEMAIEAKLLHLDPDRPHDRDHVHVRDLRIKGNELFTQRLFEGSPVGEPLSVSLDGREVEKDLVKGQRGSIQASWKAGGKLLEQIVKMKASAMIIPCAYTRAAFGSRHRSLSKSTIDGRRIALSTRLAVEAVHGRRSCDHDRCAVASVDGERDLDAGAPHVRHRSQLCASALGIVAR